MNAGIDYGMGTSNVDHETGIRYGAISLHSLDGSIYDDSEPIYPDTIEIECPKCACCWDTDVQGGEVNVCPECKHELTDYDVWDNVEPIGYSYNLGPEYETDYSETLNCLFILKSPFVTKTNFCSPCAPGAGNLDSPNPNGVPTYCLPDEFFEGGKAPYEYTKL